MLTVNSYIHIYMENHVKVTDLDENLIEVVVDLKYDF